MSSPEFLCVRCARHTLTCCQRSQVYATPGDVERIAAHTGRSDFVEFRPPEDAAYADQDDDPTWRDRVFRSDGSRRVLRREPNGDCTFLGPSGCTLPLEVRPLVCRLYPFQYTEAGLAEQVAIGCPLELLQPGLPLLTALDMQRGDGERWRRQLYAEIRREPEGGRSPCSSA